MYNVLNVLSIHIKKHFSVVVQRAARNIPNLKCKTILSIDNKNHTLKQRYCTLFTQLSKDIISIFTLIKMLPKYKKKSFILDKLHRGVVNVCIAATVITGTLLVYKVYAYYRYVRPALKEVQMKAEEDLLEEGKYKALG
ncbi:uncharacterized protein LOC108622810 [Ceratina calcarata]|uniref:Uncharacterized protein LOC108622810 n=1 Tax=Ceratina calcarata TaxID=156304 RepID=A0AAJ7ISV7_9HYME|nr:uncharacterized protein LOC108622810 [Ceratina calcarata]